MSDERHDDGAAGAAMLRLVPPRRPLPGSVPRPAHPLVGRAAELKQLRRAVLDEGHRLVTLTGTGGVGKTRLAIEAAHRLWPQLDATIVYVAARAVSVADELPPLIAAAGGWAVADETNAIDVVELGLAEQPTLLMLDNGEQVERLGALVTRLLDACPDLRVLLTSRRALGVDHERVITVQPLPTEDAVELVTAAARRHDAGFDVAHGNGAAVTELCRRLDGLPLALELAAARLRLITASEMVTLLGRRFELLRDAAAGDASPRTGLWATIDWSYQLLGDEDRRRFRALAVFPDTFTLDAATAVAGCDSVDMLDTLSSLVDHHLVQPAGRTTGAARFALLETLREFATAQLEAAGERERAADAHADWCAELVHRLEPDWTTPREADVVAALDIELANLRAALAWSLAQGNAERALRIMAGGWRHWRARGRSREGLTTAEAALAVAEQHEVEPALVATALQAAGELADDSSELDRAVELLGRAAAIHADLGDEAAVAEAQNGQAQVLRELGQLDRAAALHESAAAVFRKLGMLRAHASSLNGLGGIASRRGDHAAAAAHFEHAYAIVERLGDRRAQGLVAGNVGIAKFQAGDLAGAIDAQTRGLAVADELGDPLMAMIALLNRAEVQVAAQRFDEAEAGLDRAAQMAEQSGYAYASVIVPHHRGLIAEAQGRLGDAARHHTDSLRHALDANRPLDAIECVERLAGLAGRLGVTDLARRCLGVAQLARAHSGSAPTADLDTWVAEFGVDVPEGAPHDWPSAIADLRSELERFALTYAEATGAAAVADPHGPDTTDATLRKRGLSAREAEVARLVVAGHTDRQIAAELYIGVRTVATHVSAVLRKLDVASRREVGPRLIELGADPNVTSAPRR